MKFITPEDFKCQFIHHKTLNKSDFSKVFCTQNNHVIKRFKKDPLLVDFIMELNAYAMISHPCIIKPLFWTVVHNRGYFIMEQGIGIIEAYQQKLITIDEIICDTLSAIHFLNTNGFFHGDIKAPNMIFYDGKAKLIDLGLTRRAYLNTNGEYYMQGPAYTPYSQDPEYYGLQFNNIKAEIYSLATSYIFILEGHRGEYGDIYTYKSSNPNVMWFIEEARKLQSERLTIQQLYLKAPTALKRRKYEGRITQDTPFTSQARLSALKWMVKIAIRNNIPSQTLFLALHLFHRVYDIDCPDEETLCYSCFNIASVSTGNYLQPMEINGDLIKYILGILILTNGHVLNTTYWDHATCKGQLKELLFHTCIFTYDPRRIPNLIEGEDDPSVKFVSTPRFVKEDDLVEMKTEILTYKSTAVIPLPCHIHLQSTICAIKHVWNNAQKIDFNNSDYIGIVMRNRDLLYQLDLLTAINIFTLLYINRRKLDTFVLDVICKFNWKGQAYKVLKDRSHPFC